MAAAHNAMIFFNLRQRVQKIADIARFPDAVILHIGPAYEQYLEAVADVEDAEEQLDDLLGDIFNYILDKDKAQLGIATMFEDIMLFFAKNRREQDAKVVADAAMELAQALHKRLAALGLYSKEGVLPYTFQSRPLKSDEVVISKVGSEHKADKPIKNHSVSVVYADGDEVTTPAVHPANLASLVAAIKSSTPSPAIFVDGHCIYQGYLTHERLQELQEEFHRREELAKKSVGTF